MTETPSEDGYLMGSTCGMPRLARVKPAIKSLLNIFQSYLRPQLRIGKMVWSALTRSLDGGGSFPRRGSTASLTELVISCHSPGGSGELSTEGTEPIKGGSEEPMELWSVWGNSESSLWLSNNSCALWKIFSPLNGPSERRHRKGERAFPRPQVGGHQGLHRWSHIWGVEEGPRGHNISGWRFPPHPMEHYGGGGAMEKGKGHFHSSTLWTIRSSAVRAIHGRREGGRFSGADPSLSTQPSWNSLGSLACTEGTGHHVVCSRLLLQEE